MQITSALLEELFPRRTIASFFEHGRIFPRHDSPSIQGQLFTGLRIPPAARSLLPHGPFPETRDHHIFPSDELPLDDFKQFFRNFRRFTLHEATILSNLLGYICLGQSHNLPSSNSKSMSAFAALYQGLTLKGNNFNIRP
jgi:hypothetical protein